LKDEYAGKRIKCPKCAAVMSVPEADTYDIDEPAQASPTRPPPIGPAGMAYGAPGRPNPLGYAAPPLTGSGVFDRNRFLMRQKMIAINQRYTVTDDNERPLLFVLRKTHILQSLAAILGAIVTFGLVIGIFFGIGAAIGSGLSDQKMSNNVSGIFAVIGFLLAIPACILVAILISPKRHIQFFRDEAYTAQLLEVLQDSKWQIIIATYTLLDEKGELLAKFKKNYLYNFFRKQWEVLAPDGTRIVLAKEDSIILSLLRRFLGSFYGLLRTNFIILRGEEVIGEFNRKFTIVDRYVLDMTGDPRRTLDRRIALALGVMLDTGEQR